MSISRIKAIEDIKMTSSLTDKELDWARKHINQEKTLEGMLEYMAKPKKEGGACANKNRVDKIKSMASLVRNPPSSMKDSIEWIATKEEALLGISISCSKIDDKDISSVNCTCKDFLSGLALDFYVLAVELNAIRIIKVKNGKNAGSEMAYLTVNDGSCELNDVVIFSECFNRFRGILVPKNTLLIVGTRDKKRGGIIVNDVSQI